MLYCQSRGGVEFHFYREPLERDKFFVLAALAAAALFVGLLLGGAALK